MTQNILHYVILLLPAVFLWLINHCRDTLPRKGYYDRVLKSAINYIIGIHDYVAITVNY